MSSRSRRKSNVPPSISPKTSRRPLRISRASSVGMIPVRASMRQWAIEPRMSWRYSRRSTFMEAPNSSASSLGPLVKRPPPTSISSRSMARATAPSPYPSPRGRGDLAHLPREWVPPGDAGEVLAENRAGGDADRAVRLDDLDPAVDTRLFGPGAVPEGVQVAGVGVDVEARFGAA